MSKNLLKSSYVVATMTMISRITGLSRDLVFAAIFGAGTSMDAFLVAFRIPNFMRQLFAEGAFSQALIPTLAEYREQKSSQELKIFVNRMCGNLSFVLSILTIVAIAAAPLLVIMFAPGYAHDSSQLSLASAMLRVTFPYLLLISLAAYCGAILNVHDNFSVPAFTPIFFNLSLIFVAIFLSPFFVEPIKAAAWGVLIGGTLQLAFQIPFLKKINMIPKPQLCFRDYGVIKVIKLIGPALIGVSMSQIGFFIDLLFASFLREGSISWLYFSNRLTGFPLGVFGVAIATVILPHLSRQHSRNSTKDYSESMDWALRCVLVVGIPSSVGILMLSGPMIATFLNYGRFNELDVIMSAKSLMAFAIGLPSFMLVKILAVGFYSKQNMKTPVKVAVLATAMNIIGNLLLIGPLKHAGLALATSLTSTLNAGCLWFLLRRQSIYMPQFSWFKYLTKLAFAISGMIVVLLVSKKDLDQWLAWNSFTRFWHLGIYIVLATVTFFVCLFVTGIRYRDFTIKQKHQ